MMKYFIALLSLTIAIQFNATAQRNYKPGYVVTLNGDTTKGFIDYKEWNQNPRDITFKTTEQAATVQYLPAEIRAFGVTGFDDYLTYIGPITKGAVDLGDLSSGIDSSFVNDNVFLRVLTSGKDVSLYRYDDKIKTRYFVADGTAAPVELKRFVYLDSKQSDKIREYNFYMQQLLALALKYQPADKNLAERIQKLPYRNQEIEDVVLKLDGTNNNIKKTAAARGGLRFFAGISANSFKTTIQDKETPIGKAEPSNTISPGVNFGVDVFFNKNVGKWIFRTEVGLSTNKVNFDSKSTVVDYLNVYKRNDQLTFNQFTVTVTPQLVFNAFNKPNFKAYLAAGAQINFTNYNNYKHDIQDYLNGVQLGDFHNTNNYLRKTYPTAILKAGAVVSKRFDIYVAYSTQAKLTNFTSRGSYSFNVDSYRIGVNYLFGKQ